MGMSVYEKIRKIRELNRWSQEEMAKRLNMSPNGYAKIERGETKLRLEKLMQIAQVFNMDVLELMADDKGMVFMMNESCDYMGATTYYHTHYAEVANSAEIEKLKLIIEHKDEIIEQKNSELAALKKIIALLEQAGKISD